VSKLKEKKMKSKELPDLDKFIESHRDLYGEGVSIKDIAMAIFGGTLCMGFIYGLLTLVMWGIW